MAQKRYTKYSSITVREESRKVLVEKADKFGVSAGRLAECLLAIPDEVIKKALSESETLIQKIKLQAKIEGTKQKLAELESE